MADEIKKLNREQLEAVKFGQGPLLIIAGAGTGKTTVITERIKWLVSCGKARPSEILALTFTDKASREMEERVDVVMPMGFTQMWISTFHAFCDRILRQEALHIGLDPGYNLLTQAETIQFLKQHLFKFELNYFRPLGNPMKFIEGMIQHFSRLKDEDVSPEEYLRWVEKLDRRTATQRAQKSVPSLKFSAFSVAREVSENTANLPEGTEIGIEEIQKYLELARAYKTYEELKVKEGVMDFSDLIANVLKLFRTRSNVLLQYQKQFKYILVDEFQDTNYAQYELIKLLAPLSEKPNLTVVGDDSQSIYKFRGAAISNILQFMDDYKTAKQVILNSNYRSTQTILDHAYKLIKYNDPDTLEAKLGISKDLRAVRPARIATQSVAGGVEFIHEDRVENEAEEVAKKIATLKVQKNSEGTDYRWKDFAILVRANNHADPFMRALARHGIPYQFLGPGMLFRQSEVKDLIAYLKVLANFEDSVAMYRVLAMDFFDIEGRDLAAISNYGRKHNLSLFEAAETVEKIFVSAKTRETVEKIVKMINRHLGLMKKETAGQILYFFLEDSGLLKKLAIYNNTQDERKASNISKFFDKLKTYEVEHEDASVFAVSDWIDLSLELGESPLAADMDWTENDAVNILTVHSSKGLEFPVVFLVNLVSQRFPTSERREQIPIPEDLIKEILPIGDYHLEEERRLFYVGMTRARDRLFLTAADYYGEGKREKKISPFVVEAMGKSLSTQHETRNTQQLSIFEWSKPQKENVTSSMLHVPCTYLTYSMIQTFQECPMHYKAKYILGLPTPASAALSFGTSLHATLRDFYKLRTPSQPPDEKFLMELYQGNWIDEGYEDKKHEKLAFEKGQRFLRAFLKEKSNLLVKPAAIEQPFRFKLRDLIVAGKIDRIDARGDDKIEIIDYKTGVPPHLWPGLVARRSSASKTGAAVPEQERVDKDLQLAIYALAATQVPEKPFAKKPEEVALSLYYFETGEKLKTAKTKEQLEETKKTLISWQNKISASDFACNKSERCKNCEYRLLCEN